MRLRAEVGGGEVDEMHLVIGELAGGHLGGARPEGVVAAVLHVVFGAAGLLEEVVFEELGDAACVGRSVVDHGGVGTGSGCGEGAVVERLGGEMPGVWQGAGFLGALGLDALLGLGAHFAHDVVEQVHLGDGSLGADAGLGEADDLVWGAHGAGGEGVGIVGAG